MSIEQEPTGSIDPYLDTAFIRGDFVPFQDATVPVATNALQYGNGIFGGIKGYQMDGQTGIFRLDEHVRRLRNSAKILRYSTFNDGIDVDRPLSEKVEPFDFDENRVKDIIIELTRRNSPTDNVYIRPFIYRSDIALSPGMTGDFDLAVYMLKLGDYFDKSKGMDVCVSPWVKVSDNAIPPRTKVAGGYVSAALATHDAEMNGYDSAIMLDQNGHVSEGAVMNMFIVRDGEVITPQINSDLLEGITRRTLITELGKAGINVTQRPIDRSELYIADEVIFSGTATEVAWTASVDRVQISDEPGPVFKDLNERFTNLISQPNEYLTMVGKKQ